MYYRGCCGLGATLQPGMTPRLPRPSWAPSMPGAMYYRDESAWNYRWMRDFEVLGRESYTLAAEYHPTPNSIVYTFRGKPYAWGEWRADRSFQGEVAPVPRRGALRGYGTSIDTIRLQHPPLARRGSRRFMGYGEEPVETASKILVVFEGYVLPTEQDARDVAIEVGKGIQGEGLEISSTQIVPIETGTEHGYMAKCYFWAPAEAASELPRKLVFQPTDMTYIAIDYGWMRLVDPAEANVVLGTQNVTAEKKTPWWYWGLGGVGSLLLLGGAFYAGKKSKGR